MLCVADGQAAKMPADVVLAAPIHVFGGTMVFDPVKAQLIRCQKITQRHDIFVTARIYPFSDLWARIHQTRLTHAALDKAVR